MLDDEIYIKKELKKEKKTNQTPKPELNSQIHNPLNYWLGLNLETQIKCCRMKSINSIHF